ncbi:MAG TPA: sugar transferase [Herpetosiphonaceae bacterium]
MKNNRWSGNRSLLLRESLYAWILLLLNVILFTVIAILLSLVIASQQMVVVIALSIVIPIMIYVHLALYKRDYSLGFIKRVDRSVYMAQWRTVRREYYLAKRIFDVLIATLVFPLFLIIFAVCALLLKIEAPGGPILMRREGIGQGGRRFKIYTFRTMMPDLAMRLTDAASWGSPLPAFKLRDDPRITRVGKFLRRTGLDQLPQLINVLRGDISFVGIEPEVVSHQPMLLLHNEFPLVQPGLTGFWRIYEGRSLSIDERLRLEVAYITTASFWLDMKILWWTLGSLAFGQDWAIARVERERGRNEPGREEESSGVRSLPPR